MQELADQIQRSFVAMVESGKLNTIIQTNVEKSVEAILTECFAYNSPFRRAIGEHINQTWKIDFADLGLAGYNEIILQIIRRKVDACVALHAEKHITESLEKLLQPAPAEIKLSDLVQMLEQVAREDRRHGDAESESVVSWHLVRGHADGWLYLKLDPKPHVTVRDCRYDLAITDKGEVYRIGLPYHGDVSKQVFAGPFYGFDRALFQLYARKTRLLIDEATVEDVA